MGKRQLTHDEAVREVYRLTPQIRDYDEFMYMGVRWLAYTMFFHHNNYRSEVINTDALGFRLSEYAGQSVGLADLPADTEVNLLVGGSTALGTGASTDAWTVPSRLSHHTGRLWLNFSGRGYNAVQELLLFLMHQHRFVRIGQVIVLSGINTLALEGLPDNLATEHGRYYYSFEYEHYMNRYNQDLKRRANTYASELESRSRGLLSRYIGRLLEEDQNPADVVLTDDGTDTPERVRRAAWVVSHALHQWQKLLAGTGASLSFALQPMSYWTRDFLTAEEEAVFHAIDSCPNNFWRLFSRILGKEIHAPFANAIEDVCRSKGIGFVDVNELLKASPLIDETLFVDRVHFNDKGYDEVARLIARELVL